MRPCVWWWRCRLGGVWGVVMGKSVGCIVAEARGCGWIRVGTESNQPSNSNNKAKQERTKTRRSEPYRSTEWLLGPRAVDLIAFRRSINWGLGAYVSTAVEGRNVRIITYGSGFGHSTLALGIDRSTPSIDQPPQTPAPITNRTTGSSSNPIPASTNMPRRAAAAPFLPLLLLLAGGLCGKGEAFLRPGSAPTPNTLQQQRQRQQGVRAGVSMMAAYSEPKPLPNDPPFRIGHGFDIHRLEPGVLVFVGGMCVCRGLAAPRDCVREWGGRTCVIWLGINTFEWGTLPP